MPVANLRLLGRNSDPRNPQPSPKRPRHPSLFHKAACGVWFHDYHELSGQPIATVARTTATYRPSAGLNGFRRGFCSGWLPLVRLESARQGFSDHAACTRCSENPLWKTPVELRPTDYGFPVENACKTQNPFMQAFPVRLMFWKLMEIRRVGSAAAPREGEWPQRHAKQGLPAKPCVAFLRKSIPAGLGRF